MTNTYNEVFLIDFIRGELKSSINIQMMNSIVALGYGLIVFAILIGVGSVVLFNFGNAAGGAANTNVQYVLTQLGSTGLAGWTPAIIAICVGMLFLGFFAVGKGQKM